MDGDKFKISLTPGSQMWLRLVSGINRLLVLFSIREKRKFWGIVYDSVNKQPLDPALITLAYTEGAAAQTSITDMEGGYGFLAHAGKFKILAKKSNYVFPSKLIAGNSDGIYDNLYHGEFFTLDDYEVVAPNIPMDPENADWNQEAKLKMGRRDTGVEYTVKILLSFIFWAAFVLLCVEVWAVTFHPWAGLPNLQSFFYIYAGAAFYLIILLLAMFTPEVRLWGKIIYSGSRPLELVMELTKTEIPDMLFGKTEVQENGSFLLRATPGPYNLIIKRKDKEGNTVALGQIPIKIGAEKIVNQNIKLSDVNL